MYCWSTMDLKLELLNGVIPVKHFHHAFECIWSSGCQVRHSYHGGGEKQRSLCIISRVFASTVWFLLMGWGSGKPSPPRWQFQIGTDQALLALRHVPIPNYYDSLINHCVVHTCQEDLCQGLWTLHAQGAVLLVVHSCCAAVVKQIPLG